MGVVGEANREESQRCLRLSKAAQSRGDHEQALRMAAKAMRLFDCPEARAWLTSLQSSDRDASAATATTTGFSPIYTKEQEDEVSDFLKINKSDFYAVLGVKRTAEPDELKRAYKKMALKFHPDKNQAPGADEAFKAVGTAFATLSDSDKRSRYDMFGGAPSDGGFPSTSRHQSAFSFSTSQHEVPMEDLFNMFFNAFADESAGNGGFASQGMFFHQFPQFPQYAKRRHQTHHRNLYEEETERRRRARRHEDLNHTALAFRAIQLLPLFLILVLSFLSNLFFPRPSE